MKKQFIILFTILSTGLLVNAQEEYRITKSSGQLKINLTGIIVEGYDGKEIIFSGQKTVVDETDERAKGLLAISGSKYTDNTGLGISVTENGQDVNVNLVSKKPIGVLTIKVPQNIKVSIINNSMRVFFNSGATTDHVTFNPKGEEIILKNLKNEIEVSVNNNKIRLENNTGPMNIKTVSGSVDAIFNTDIKGPISIISVTNYVDITLPASTKANLQMGTTYGKLYASKEFKIDFDKEEAEKTAYSINTNGTEALSRLSSNLAKQGVAATIIAGAKVDDAKIKGTPVASGDLHYTSVYSFDSFSMGGGDKIKGKLNGGGVDLIFKSTNKNVYLRQ